MATINPVLTRINGDDSVVRFFYETLTTTNHTGAAIPFAQWADRSVQVTGTFGAGGNLKVEGSNDDGVTWATLTDPQGNALDFTAAKIEAVTEIVQLVRPRASAGDGTTDLDVSILCRRPQPLRT